MPVVKYVTEYVRQKEKETGKVFKLTLTTNGVLLNDENIKWLNDNNISMVLSLDGRKEVHDYMRPDVGGHGTYDKVVKNFKKLVDSVMVIITIYVVHSLIAIWTFLKTYSAWLMKVLIFYL